MKQKRWLKTLLAGVFLTAVLAVPLGIMVGTTKPTLSLMGVEMNMMEDGSAQMLFTVGVSNVQYSYGARLRMDYNPEYLIPSRYTDNSLFSEEDGMTTDDFFSASPALYKENGVSKNPFDTKTENNFVDQINHQVSLSLFTLQDGLKEEAEEVTDRDLLFLLSMGEGYEDRFVFDAKGKTVALGVLSFRVTDLSKLPQIIEKFDPIIDDSTPVVDGDYLINFDKTLTWGKGPWAVGACIGSSDTDFTPQDLDPLTPLAGYKATAEFTFDFPETIIGVAAAEADLTLDAYRVYNSGSVNDVVLAMQKYSPSVIATYADGKQRTFILPWQGAKVTQNPAGDYNPTQGDYNIKQDFKYIDANNKEVTFPVPVDAHLKVTPITLEKISADDLHKTYTLKNALVTQDGVDEVQTAAQFKLPSQARLITDIPAGGASLTMTVPGWSPTEPGSKWPAADEKISTLRADGSTAKGVNIHWPTEADIDKWTAEEDTTVTPPATVTDRRKGTYSFTMAATYGGVATNFKKADIRAAYPWLTVPDETYEMPAATRRLVGSGEQIEKDRYVVKYIATKTDAYRHPELALQVSRLGDGTSQEVDMAADSKFRVLLPDGTELGTGLTSGGTVGGTINVDNWFPATATHHGSYAASITKVGDYSKDGYQLTTAPGNTDAASGTYAQERELLRRYINLGGWFSVAVNEDPDTYAWSDFIPVYVPPRDNIHTENKEYNFVGLNAGLFGWPGDLNTTVNLPQGSYWVVDPTTGKRLYESDNITPKMERYGVRTTYDGATGVEPGELNTFAVDSWTKSVVSTKTTYGPNNFADGVRYGAYGTVKNPTPDQKTATVRKEGAIPAAATEGITLTYDGTGSVSKDGDGNVTLVTYATRTQGYTIRQDYTLTITNVGTTDIYGLNIDSTTGGGHFVLLKPPATFLPAGGKTTFTLTYVYDLRANGGLPLDYRDTLYITSTGHNNVAGGDYLREFDAQFRVSAEDIHSVVVKYEPTDGCMGTAKVIIGEIEDAAAVAPAPKYTMNTTAGTTAFRKGDKVYIMASMKDEYVVDTAVCVDGAGTTIVMTPYVSGDGATAGSAKLPKGVAVYTFTMPDYDATVTIKFKEPISSKLRLSDMKAFADKTAADLKPTQPNPAEYTIWQKTYSEKEEKAAAQWVLNGGKEGEYLMGYGTATKAGLSELGTDETVEQYLVVIPYEAEYAQVQVTLRQVVYTLSGANPNITPTVSMYLYDTKPTTPGGITTSQVLAPENGDTATPTTHHSTAFLSPKPSASKYVRVDIEVKEGSTTITRSYYLEVHRRPKDVSATLNYGNSPYGMIMNDPAINGKDKDPVSGLTDKQKAKAAFVNNGYTFRNLTTGVPAAVTTNHLQNVRYWTEAWVDVNGLYDPESGIGLPLYDETKNMDLNDEALFVIQNKPFLDPGLASATDSSGRPVDLTKATMSVKVIMLDAAALTQDKRFEGPAPGDPDQVTARTAELKFGVAGKTVTTWETVGIRPGLYALEYRFLDYDGTTPLIVTRPFILLSDLGDVNADNTVKADDRVTGVGGDEGLVKGRVTAPLGYMAKEYPNAAIFKFRCCDVNNDRNINNIDANTIRAGVKTPALLQNFYLPTAYRPTPTPTP